MPCVSQRLVPVARWAQRLQVVRVVCAALGLGRDVIDLAGRCVSVLGKAGLALVLVAGQDELAQLVPCGAVAAFVACPAVVVPALAGVGCRSRQ